MKLFFIIGAPKTGTTLTARLMDCHPEIACTTELFPFQVKGGKRSESPIFRSKLKDHGIKDDFGKIRVNSNHDVSIVMREALRRFAKNCGRVNIVGDKFVWYISFLEDMLEMFPDAKYIYIVRDPRAVWNSAKHFTHIGRADKLLKTMLHYDRKLVKYYDDRFITIKYESLFKDNKAIQEIYKFVGAEKYKHVPQMLHKPVYPERFKGIKNSCDPLDSRMAVKWITMMTKGEIARVNKMSTKFMEKYGYA